MRNSFKNYLMLMMLAIFAMPSLYSEMSKKDESFYAISSLCFHLNTTLSNPKKDIFSVEDVSELWNSACDSKEMTSLILARDLYYQSQNENEDEARLLLTKAQIILEDVWKRSNVYLKSPDSVISKGKINNVPVTSNYLLPENSPLRASLSKIFNSTQVNKDIKSLLDSGFSVVSERVSGMYVLRHPLLQGHLIKTFPETKVSHKRNKVKIDWRWLVFRCWGATNIQKLIKDKKLKHFEVPNKWIYPLAKYEIGIDGDFAKVRASAVLVVTDMNLSSDTESKKAWKTATRKQIYELYVILSHGYASCRLASNIPVTKKGKFACIDTERPQRILKYDLIVPYLSKKMKNYFFKLLKAGGKQIKENKHRDSKKDHKNKKDKNKKDHKANKKDHKNKKKNQKKVRV